MRRSSIYMLCAIALLLCACALVLYAVALEDRQARLTVSFLDVGQGDAIFIESPSGSQILIDGGPNATVVRRLANAMPWYDRTIDLVIATHPDADHIGGLIDVLDRFVVHTIALSSVLGTTPLSATFDQKVAAEGAAIIDASRGDIFDLGGGAQLEILFPDRSLPGVETNVGCVVSRITYGETAFMLPCDAPDEIELYLARLASTQLGTGASTQLGTGDSSLKANVLKAAHHGSKTSSAAAFVGYVAPEYAVYSRGCDNTYGHPHPEVVTTYARFGIPTLDTCEEGTITFVSDGVSVSRK